MDPEDQEAIRKLTESEGKESLLVVLGYFNPESIRVAVETVTSGDPSQVGPLSGVPLGLQVYHVLEVAFRRKFSKEIYERHLGIYSAHVNLREIEGALKEARGGGDS